MLDLDRTAGYIRGAAHAHSADGGLAVLRGNLAPDGCVVKTASVDTGMLVFSGPARVYESQDEAVEGSSAGRSVPGTWWSSGTRAPREARACRRCSTRPRT